jgi:hypothetical protein
LFTASDPKLNPFEGALGLTADGGAPNNGLGGAAASEAGADPNEKAAFDGVGAAKEMFANGLDFVGVPS